MTSSPPFLHSPFPISQITSSTIILGSAGVKSSSSGNSPPTKSIPTPTPETEMTHKDNVEGSSPISTTSNSPSPDHSPRSSGTIAIPFSDKQVEASDVLVTTSDPPERCTSPRRDNVAIEKIGREKVQVLRKEAQLIQESLTDILDRIIKVKEDYDRLSNENKFLQDYIGNLMSTSNILNKTHHT